MKKEKILLACVSMLLPLFALSSCGPTSSSSIDDHVHSFSESWESDENYHWHASLCGHDVKGDLAAHSYGEWEVVTEASEAEEGEKQRKCDVCNYVQTEAIEKLPHTHVFSEAWESDESYHWHASLCGHDVKDSLSEHSYGEWLVSKEATEEEEGEKYRVCSICEYVQYETIEKLPHTHVFSEAWESDESYHWHASLCGHDVKDGLAEHSYGEWVVSKEATEYASGEKKRTCSICQRVETATIDKLPHTHTYSDEYSYNAYSHWRNPLCWDAQAIDADVHDFNDDNVCIHCGYQGVNGNHTNVNRIILGKDRYLFEQEYIQTELGFISTDNGELSNKISKLSRIQNSLNARGQELYLFITPSKADFFHDKIPAYYVNSPSATNSNDYSRFITLLQQSDLHYFDCPSYLKGLQAKGECKAPVFYRTGNHWSSYAGLACSGAFMSYINQNSKWNLGQLNYYPVAAKTSSSPDNDLYSELGIGDGVMDDEQYYYSNHWPDGNSQKPVFFLRGGSFMGQSLTYLVSSKVMNEKTAYFENNYIFKDNFSSLKYISSNSAYNEYTDFSSDFDRSNIVVLEINECAIYKMSFGFIDYLANYLGV